MLGPCNFKFPQFEVSRPPHSYPSPVTMYGNCPRVKKGDKPGNVVSRPLFVLPFALSTTVYGERPRQ